MDEHLYLSHFPAFPFFPESHRPGKELLRQGKLQILLKCKRQYDLFAVVYFGYGLPAVSFSNFLLHCQGCMLFHMNCFYKRTSHIYRTNRILWGVYCLNYIFKVVPSMSLAQLFASLALKIVISDAVMLRYFRKLYLWGWSFSKLWFKMSSAKHETTYLELMYELDNLMIKTDEA